MNNFGFPVSPAMRLADLSTALARQGLCLYWDVARRAVSGDGRHSIMKKHVQRNGFSGSPRVVGSTRASKADRNPG